MCHVLFVLLLQSEYTVRVSAGVHKLKKGRGDTFLPISSDQGDLEFVASWWPRGGKHIVSRKRER